MRHQHLISPESTFVEINGSERWPVPRPQRSFRLYLITAVSTLWVSNRASQRSCVNQTMRLFGVDCNLIIFAMTVC